MKAALGSRRDWALSYAARGWPVLPLWWPDGGGCACPDQACGDIDVAGERSGSPAKHPIAQLVGHGLQDATCDAARIESWWARYPMANIGLRTGVGFDVLDIDGADGEAALVAARGNRSEPTGPVARTGGGGRHVWVRPTGEGNRAGLVDHVDWRGTGGYVVAPPSVHASGQRYTWVLAPDDVALAVCPTWLLRLIQRSPGTCQAEVLLTAQGWLARCRACRFSAPPQPTQSEACVLATRHHQRGTNDGPRPTEEPTERYVAVAVERAIRDVAHAAEGQRNHTLNAAAYGLYKLVAARALAESTVTEEMTAAATRAGLTDREIAATLGSARRAALTAN